MLLVLAVWHNPTAAHEVAPWGRADRRRAGGGHARHFYGAAEEFPPPTGTKATWGRERPIPAVSPEVKGKAPEKGGVMSGLNEAVTWLVYAIAAVVMLSATVAAIAFGLALRLVAEFFRELVDGREGDGRRQHPNDEPTIPARARDSV